MLAKATRTLQEQFRDVAEKTKSTCCVGGCGGKKSAAAEKERMRSATVVNDGIPVRYVYDNVSGTTYVRGRLLGKVSPACVNILCECRLSRYRSRTVPDVGAYDREGCNVCQAKVNIEMHL